MSVCRSAGLSVEIHDNNYRIFYNNFVIIDLSCGDKKITLDQSLIWPGISPVGIRIKAFEHDQYNSCRAFYCTNNNTLIFLTRKIILIYIFLTIVLCLISDIRYPTADIRRRISDRYPTGYCRQYPRIIRYPPILVSATPLYWSGKITGTKYRWSTHKIYQSEIRVFLGSSFHVFSEFEYHTNQNRSA